MMKIGYKVWLDNNGKAFGSSSCELLKRVEETHSLHRASKEMGMAYTVDRSHGEKVGIPTDRTQSGGTLRRRIASDASGEGVDEALSPLPKGREHFFRKDLPNPFQFREGGGLEMRKLPREVRNELDIPVVLVTYDFEDAYLLGNHILIYGRVKQVGERDDIFQKPQSKSVAQFLGLRNLFRAKILKKDEHLHRLILEVDGLRFSISADSRRSPVQVGMEVDLYVRPGEIMIIREGKPVKESLRHNIFVGEIVDIIDRSNYRLVYFQTLKGKILFEISIPNYAFRNLDLSTGKTVRIALREESLWVMV